MTIFQTVDIDGWTLRSTGTTPWQVSTATDTVTGTVYEVALQSFQFPDLAPVAIRVTQGSAPDDLKFVLSPYLVNLSGKPWDAFTISLVDDYNPIPQTAGHPYFAHFHDDLYWGDPAKITTGDFWFEGYNNTTDVYGVNGGNQLFLSAGEAFPTGTSQQWSGLGIHQFDFPAVPGSVYRGGDFYIVLTPGRSRAHYDEVRELGDGTDSFAGEDHKADLIYGLDGNDIISGRSGDDTLVGGSGRDRLLGGAGDDELFGGSEADRLEGGTGNDEYHVDHADDLVIDAAEAGSVDRVRTSVNYQLSAAAEIEYLEGYNNAASTVPLRLTGNGFGQVITGNQGGNVLRGLGGDDELFGDGGEDILDGGANDDRLYGGDGNDRLLGGDGNDRLYGGAGLDTFQGVAGDDQYWIEDSGENAIEAVGGGHDIVHVNGWNVPVFTLRADAEVEVIAAIGYDDLYRSFSSSVRLTGNGFGQTLYGDAGDNVLKGLGGADVLEAGAGHDVLDGGTGADAMAGFLGNDRYVVDDTGDTVVEERTYVVPFFYYDEEIGDHVYYDEEVDGGLDTVYASVGFSLATAPGVENLILQGAQAIDGVGNELANRLIGNGAQNRLEGLAGNDWLQGGLRDDVLLGGADDDILQGEHGQDTLDGGSGRDRLDGGIGHDRLTGGADSDTFIFAGAFGLDTIVDFQDSGAETRYDGLDRIDLRGLRAVNGGQALSLADLLITQAGTSTLLRLDLDNDGVEDRRDLDGNGTADIARITLLDTSATAIDRFDFLF